MTRLEQVQTAVSTVDHDGSADVIRPRRAGKQTSRMTSRATHRRRTEHSCRVSDTGRQMQHADSPSVRVADSRQEQVSRCRSETESGHGNSKARTKRRRDVRSTRSGLSVVTPNSTYAGARFTGGAPSASLLPLPPSHWLTVACSS